jgi:Reverse transcriptase (RNA-dependent DNA polymerase)
MNLAIAVANDMETWQVDYVAAYLNLKPQAEIYIELPEGAEIQGKIGRLNRTLYGTMDKAYNWWETLDAEMADLGYYHSKADPLVHSRYANRNITIISTYTDNTTGISSSPEEAERAKEELGWRYEVKDLGKANMFLGIHVKRDGAARTISISQRTYLKRILKRFGMTDCNTKPTPLPLGVTLSKDPKIQEDRVLMADKPYHEVLGSIMYAQIGTRPDLSYAVLTLSKYASNPGITHWNALMHILQYIKVTLNYKITYGGKNFKDLRLTGWVDADYGGDIDSQRSCAGYVFI